jgi:hypothetical protein
MRALLEQGTECPGKRDWETYYGFSVRPFLQAPHKGERAVGGFEVIFEDHRFIMDRCALSRSLIFRDAIFQSIGTITPPVGKAEWRQIIEAAVANCYIGCRAKPPEYWEELLNPQLRFKFG